jgi:phospholipid/cholesterol/gamma-HCH transport system substrate-binding protein
MEGPSDYTTVSKTFLIEVFTGIFFIIAMILLIYFTAIIKGKDLLMSEKKQIENIVFPSVGALRVNDKVCVKGMEIGKVTKLAPGKYYRNIVVELALNEEMPIFKDYSVGIRSSSVFGGYYVLIDPGNSASGLLNKGELLKGDPPSDLISEASELVKGLRETEQKINEIVVDGKFFDNILAAVKEFNQGAKSLNGILESLKSNNNLIGRMMTDKAFADDVSEAFKNIKTASVNLSSITDGLKSGKGALGKLLSEDEAYNKLIKALDDVNKISDALASGKGSFGKIMHDDGELYNNLNESLRAASEIARKIRAGEGSLGKLVTDESLYLELKETLRQVRAAVEDFREQAPIATFGSMALGAL